MRVVLFILKFKLHNVVPTLATLNTLIYVDVIKALQHIVTFQVEDTTPRVYTGTGLNYFNLTQVSGGATFETTYSVSSL